MAKHRRMSPGAKRAPDRPMAALVDEPSRRLQAAQSLWIEGRHDDAIDLYGEAIRQEPNNVRAYVLAARAYAERFQFDRMEAVHKKLIGRAPRHPGVHHYIGETFSLLKLPERSIASFERAAHLPGAGPPTWLELASLYERAHRLDEAHDFIERTVRAGYQSPMVALVRGRIQRRQKRLSDAEATFSSLIEQTSGDSEWAIQAWSELGLLRDERGDYDGAAAAIGSCKQSQQLHERPFLEVAMRIEAQIRAMVDAVSRGDFRRWRDDAGSLVQAHPALLTGFPRSGTTLLEQLLDAHPDLVGSEERDYIGHRLFCLAGQGGKLSLLEQLNSFNQEEIEVDRRHYFAAMEYLLGEPIGGRVHLDKNPAYNPTIPLMLRILPETRLIVALRDPRDVVLSCYLRYLPLNSVSVRFLDVRQTAERYALDMSAWLKFRDLLETPWCEVRYEDTVADAAGQARRALAMLGLAWDDQVLEYRQRLTANKQVSSPSYEAVAQPIYTRAIGRWKNYERLLAPALPILEPFVREFGYD